MVLIRYTALSGCEGQKENQDGLWWCTWEEGDEVKIKLTGSANGNSETKILWAGNESPCFPAVFKNDQLTPKCLLFHPPSLQWTGSKREMKGKDIIRAMVAPCKDKERDRDNLDLPLWMSCRWRGWTEWAPSVSYIPLLPQTNPIKLDFSRTAAEHKWQQIWLLFIRGP